MMTTLFQSTPSPSRGGSGRGAAGPDVEALTPPPNLPRHGGGAARCLWRLTATGSGGAAVSRDLRRKLRGNPTIAEKTLWQTLWSFRTGGYHFRKQVELGPYYVDFACLHAQLVIEVDGETHGTNIAQTNDSTRDEYLSARGFTVLRFSNDDVLHHADGVFDLIAAQLEHRPARLRGSPPPQPSPPGGGCCPAPAKPASPTP